LIETRIVATQAFHNDESEELSVLIHQLDGASGHPGQHLVEREVRRHSLQVLQSLEEALLLDQCFEKVALGLKVVVDGRIGYARFAGDVADGGASKTAFREEAQRRVEDLLASMRAAPCAPVAGRVFCSYGEGPLLSSH